MCMFNTNPCRSTANSKWNFTFYVNNCSNNGKENTHGTENYESYEEYYNMDYNDIDTSNMTFINKIWLVGDPSDIIMKTSIFLPIVIWGIFANIVLLYMLNKNGHLRTPINLLIGNMAVADLLSLLIHPWIMLLYYYFQNYQLGEIGCKAEGGIECALLITSVTTLSVISYDRLTAIVLPQETRLGKRKVKIIMGITWIFGFVLATPLFVLRTYREREWLNFVEKYCTENISVTNTYWYIIVTILVWLPLSIMLICYSAILAKLIKYEKSILRRTKSLNVSYKKKVVKIMFAVVLTFMICRVPFTVCIYYRDYLLREKKISSNNDVINQVNGVYQTLWFVSKFLIFLNAGLNPVIYGSTNEKFRQAFKSTKFYKWLLPKTIKKDNVRIIGKVKKITKSTEVNSKRSKLLPLNKKFPSIQEIVNDNPTGAESSDCNGYLHI